MLDATVHNLSYCFRLIFDRVYLNNAEILWFLSKLDKNINIFLTIALLLLGVVSPKKFIIIFLATPEFNIFLSFSFISISSYLLGFCYLLVFVYSSKAYVQNTKHFWIVLNKRNRFKYRNLSLDLFLISKIKF